MKRYLLLFVILFVGRIGLVAQTYQYSPVVSPSTTKEWFSECSDYLIDSIDSVFPGTDVLMVNDTVINGLVYRKVFKKFGYNLSDSTYIGGLIEDSIRRVFFKASGGTGTSLGNLIFDFSLQVNDTFVSPFFYNCIFTLDSIDTALEEGILRREFTFSISNSFSYPHDFWIEGIGSLIYGIYFDSSCNGNYHLCGVWENSNNIYNNYSCIAGAINETNSDKFNFRLYPNPTTDLCTLEFDNNGQILSSSIFDITGREVMPLFTDKMISTFTFNSGSLASGVYLIEVNTANGNSAVVKMVKE